MKIYRLFIMLFAVMAVTACSEESLDPNSIFETKPTVKNKFDTWLLKNYVNPYNIRFNYQYDDKESDNTYNLIPADYDKSVALAIMMRHIWIDAYTELGGIDFMKAYCPRMMQLIGSPAYSSNEEIVMGTAEGGVKITMYNVNVIDVDNPYIDLDSPFVDKSTSTKDLNYWFFHTMHHEFAHILHQKKNYSTDFNLISAGTYKTSDWINLKDKDAPALGFVSGYGSKEENEDFAEIFSIYVTHTETAWQQILEAGVVTIKNQAGVVTSIDSSGKQKIMAKFDIVKDYLAQSWNIDLVKLRDVVLRRSREVDTLDLKTLN